MEEVLNSVEFLFFFMSPQNAVIYQPILKNIFYLNGYIFADSSKDFFFKLFQKFRL